MLTAKLQVRMARRETSKCLLRKTLIVLNLSSTGDVKRTSFANKQPFSGSFKLEKKKKS